MKRRPEITLQALYEFLAGRSASDPVGLEPVEDETRIGGAFERGRNLHLFTPTSTTQLATELPSILAAHANLKEGLLRFEAARRVEQLDAIAATGSQWLARCPSGPAFAWSHPACWRDEALATVHCRGWIVPDKLPEVEPVPFGEQARMSFGQQEKSDPLINTAAFQWLSPTDEPAERLGLVRITQRSQAQFGDVYGTPFQKVRLGVAAPSPEFAPWLRSGRLPALEGRVRSLVSADGSGVADASRLRVASSLWSPGQRLQTSELASGGIEDVTLFKLYRIFRLPMGEAPPLMMTDTLMFAFERTTGELVYIEASRSELFWFKGLHFEEHALGLWLAEALSKKQG